jgi:hypothetical protein
MKLSPPMPPLTCQLANPAQAGANSPHLSQKSVSYCIGQLAAQSKSGTGCVNWVLKGRGFSRADENP